MCTNDTQICLTCTLNASVNAHIYSVIVINEKCVGGTGNGLGPASLVPEREQMTHFQFSSQGGDLCCGLHLHLPHPLLQLSDLPPCGYQRLLQLLLTSAGYLNLIGQIAANDVQIGNVRSCKEGNTMDTCACTHDGGL